MQPIGVSTSNIADGPRKVNTLLPRRVGGRPPAWDPFEVWRTRVRDVRDRRSQRKTPPEED